MTSNDSHHNFENVLVEGIQPIRNYVLACAIFHAFNNGIIKTITGGTSTIRKIADIHGIRIEQLRGLMWYLKNEGVVTINHNEEVRLTEYGKTIERCEPWYTMLIGGYGNTYLDIGQAIKDPQFDCSRDAGLVGIGSCGISQYDSIPLTKKLMDSMPSPAKKLLDLGCGNALYLSEFCKAFPEIESCCGVEPSKKAVDEAKQRIESSGQQSKIKLINQTAQQYLDSDLMYTPDLLVMGFVLHEILGQDDEAGVIDFIKRIYKKHPDMHMIVIEVEDKMEDAKIMSHDLAMAYYNPYYLMHYFTKQKLVDYEAWLRIFEQAGLEVIAQHTTDINVDSTGLEIGFLLRSA